MSEESTPRKPAVYCPYCGEEIEKMEGFCPRCGVDLTDGNEGVSLAEGEEPLIQEQPEENKKSSNTSPKKVPPSLVPSPPKTHGVRCVHCKGTGFCQFCHGAGSIHKQECSECGGTGRCVFCKGTGRIE